MKQTTIWLKKTEQELMTDAFAEMNFSPAKAQKMQKEYYLSMQKPKPASKTPPHFLVADQLETSIEQIFQAAVYNLGKIAESQPQYRKEILLILSEYVDDKRRSEEMKKYVKDTISRIKNMKKTS